MKLLLSLVFTATLLPTLSEAQAPIGPPRYGLEASRQHSPGGAPLIGYSREISGRWITEFYMRSQLNAESEPVVFARRALDSYDAQEHIQWADSRDCPELIAQLLRLNDLATPSVIIPLDEASRARRAIAGPPLTPSADGPGPYVFWAMTFGVIGYEVRFSTFGGPWHAWANDMENSLKLCWVDQMPSMAPRT